VSLGSPDARRRICLYVRIVCARARCSAWNVRPPAQRLLKSPITKALTNKPKSLVATAHYSPIMGPNPPLATPLSAFLASLSPHSCSYLYKTRKTPDPRPQGTRRAARNRGSCKGHLERKKKTPTEAGGCFFWEFPAQKSTFSCFVFLKTHRLK
jgi:hypothetical protein